MVTAAQKSERNFVTRNAHSCNLLSAVHGCLKLEVPQQTWLPHPILTKQGGSSWHFRYPGSFVSSRHCPCQWSKSVRPLPPPAAHHGRCPLPLLLLCHMSGALPKHPKNVACQNYETTGSLWPPAVWSQKSSGPPDSSAKLETPHFFVDLRNTFFLGEPNFANDGGFIHMFWNHFQPEKLGVQMIHLTPIWRLANRRICFSPNWVGWNSTTKNLLSCYESIPREKLNLKTQTDRGLAIALPEAGLARGWRPTDPLGRNDMFFFSDGVF